MKPTLDTRQLNAFVDGELDLKSQLDIEEHLRTDAVAQARVEGLRQLRTAVREAADYHLAPEALRQRMSALLAPQAGVVVASAPANAAAAGGTALQRWFGWRPLVASFGMVSVLAVALNVAWWRSAQEAQLMDDVVASHVRATLGQHLVDVASSDRHTVKPWLSARLGYSPPVAELPVPGSVFLGGRVDYLDGRPVAALVYRQGEHIVNAFVWPTTARDIATGYGVERGFQTAHWSRAGMTHWVISDLNREEFGALVQALETVGVTGSGGVR